MKKTVRQFIEELQKLDPDRNIWVLYDFPCDTYPPEVTVVGYAEAEEVKEEGVEPGDYCIYAS